MNLVPKSVSRFTGRSMLKLNASSPTILVVAGVVGFGATAVMAARASRRVDPIIENHKKSRAQLSNIVYSDKRAQQKDLVRLYSGTTIELGKLYGPTIVVGALSAAAVLSGHRIMKGRYVGAVAAYSGLFEQFKDYRSRVAEVIGDDKEKDLYDGAKLAWEEDPDHKGEYKLNSKFEEGKEPGSYIRPWFDETNTNWTRNAEWNYFFLKGVQQHLNNRLQTYGHVFVNEAREALGLPRCREGVITGWLRDDKTEKGDGFIDLGFMTGNEPNTIAFRNGVEKSVRLNFNIDGSIWDKI